jgi:signal transduction histidine kinase
MSLGLELLRARHAEPESQVMLARLDNSVRRMASIVDQLLDVTRARLGTGISLDRTPLYLRPLIASVLDELRLAFRTTAFELRGDDVNGGWDGDRLAQVISNLASNAAQYGKRGGSVTVEIARAGGFATIAIVNEIRDAPISGALLETLFDPFKRGRDTKRPGGLGLGLYIVREIVSAHGGTIEVTSDNAGTTFRVVLPLDCEVVAPAATA